MEERIKPQRDYSERDRKRAQARRRRKREKIKKLIIFFFVIIVVGVIGGAVLIKKYGPSKEKADLEKYYGIKNENQLAVIIDNEVIGVGGIMLNGRAYLDYPVVRDQLNGRFYVDYNENVLLYTLPNGTITVGVGSEEYTFQKEKKNVGYPILKMDGNTAYIALEFIQDYTNIDFRVYEKTNEEPNRVTITTDWGEKKVATIKKNTQVRCLGGVKSPILTEVAKKDKVIILENVEKVEGWTKIRTKDGYVGYVKESTLKDQRTETISREFEEPVYDNIKKDYTINLAWHVVTNRTANDSVLSMIADTKGLTTLSPTWFTVADTQGNINSLASSQYVNYAHQSNIEVWGLVRDFDGGINSYEESHELLSRTSSRENLINQLIAEALKTGLDGINVDFELISTECGEHYIQFIRELSVKCRQNGIILSVDNYVPKGYNAHYNLKEQGIVADYVIIMGYDEHTAGSYESGPVASLEFVRSGIEETIEVVPKEKTINAVPFYTRLWKEVPKTEGEIAAEAANESTKEASKYPMKVTSTAYGMIGAERAIANAGAQIVKDEATGQNYAQWEADGATYKIWLEDEEALEEKLKLMKEYGLAGTAAWRLGFEKSSTWDLILRYVN